MRGSLRLDREAVKDLYALDRSFVPSVWKMLDALVENPDAANYQSESEDPSLYWVGIDGDHLIFFEILDEEHAILIVSIR